MARQMMVLLLAHKEKSEKLLFFIVIYCLFITLQLCFVHCPILNPFKAKEVC